MRLKRATQTHRYSKRIQPGNIFLGKGVGIFSWKRIVKL